VFVLLDEQDRAVLRLGVLSSKFQLVAVGDPAIEAPAPYHQRVCNV
jgi:hypothetical protein